MRRLVNHVQFEPAGVLVEFNEGLNAGMNEIYTDVDEESSMMSLITPIIDEA